jgi:phosphoglycolate phosphatase
VVFDLDGTLLDSDNALAAAFVACGVPLESVTRGHVVADECDRLGIALDDYLEAYDTDASKPFDGVEELLATLDAAQVTWAVCSNKHPRAAHAELERLGWAPAVALFADAFDGPKRLEPVLEALGVAAVEVLFVGDTSHDERCALDVGAAFVWAGWNPLCEPPTELGVLAEPGDALRLLDVWG